MEDGAGHPVAAGGACARRRGRRGAASRRHQSLRQQLSRPRRSSGTRRRGQGCTGHAWTGHGVRPVHLRDIRSPPRARDVHRNLSRDGGRHPLRGVLRRQWRRVRAPVRRQGRHRIRQPQPCLDHRRRAPLQGAPLPLRQRRHGRPRAEPQGSASRRSTASRRRDGRRLLHGRLFREARRHPQARRPLRCPHHGRRLPRHRLHRPEGARHAGPGGHQGRHPHRHARQGARRLGRRIHRRGAADRRPHAAAVAALSLLERPAARRRRGRHQGHRTRRKGRRPAGPTVRQRRALPQRHGRRRASSSCRGSTRSSR